MSRLTWLVYIFGLICSQVSADLSQAIIGGEYAKKGEYKYQVAILVDGKTYCGGAIIGEHYILTAAHCVADHQGKIRVRKYEVVAGADSLTDPHAIHTFAEAVFSHAYFHLRTSKNDIAILKLKDPLHLKTRHNILGKISLPKDDCHNYDHVVATVSGYGFTEIKVSKDASGNWYEHDGRSDNRLKHAKVTVIPVDECRKLKQHIFCTSICAKVHQTKNHHEGVCGGDSGAGGPLVYGHEIIGVLNSSPLGCNETVIPATYTRVTMYLDLIHHVLNGKEHADVIHEKVQH